MTERLTVEQVIELNRVECEKTGESHQLLDREGLEAAVARPWSGGGFGQIYYPSLFSKAAALLHAIAARQVFENGNKRTAWVAADTFLDINDIDLGAVPPIIAESMVRAASVDHTFGPEGVLEWLQAAQELSFDRRHSTEFIETPAGRFPATAFMPSQARMANGFIVGLTEDFELSFFRERVSMEDVTVQDMEPAKATREVLTAIGLDLTNLRGLHETVTGVLADFNVGRNDPCPCGADAKFKRCHGRPPAAN